MRLLHLAIVALAALLGEISPLGAARDEATPLRAERLEILVLEVRSCTICHLVRDNNQPAYERSPRARTIPMRFVDVTRLDETKLGLNGPITVVPTFVFMRDGKEIDRINGYVAPETFFRALSTVTDLVD